MIYHIEINSEKGTVQLLEDITFKEIMLVQVALMAFINTCVETCNKEVNKEVDSMTIRN